MPGPQDSLPQLDLTLIAFPSDRVTIGDMQKIQPRLFADTAWGSMFRMPEIPILSAATIERALARKAFAAAAGLRDPLPLTQDAVTFTRQEGVLLLNDQYKKYGLSTGLQQTRQLVRTFEAAAAAQAPSRGR